MTAVLGLPEVGIRARRRIAWRLLPFVFLIYVTNYIDRVNVSFANLTMGARKNCDRTWVTRSTRATLVEGALKASLNLIQPIGRPRLD